MDKKIQDMSVEELNALGYKAFMQRENAQAAIQQAVGIINAVEAELKGREKTAEKKK